MDTNNQQTQEHLGGHLAHDELMQQFLAYAHARAALEKRGPAKTVDRLLRLLEIDGLAS